MRSLVESPFDLSPLFFVCKIIHLKMVSACEFHFSQHLDSSFLSLFDRPQEFNLYQIYYFIHYL